MKSNSIKFTVLTLLSTLLFLCACSKEDRPVEVKPSKAELIKIMITSQPAQTTYSLGETLSLTGLVVEGIYKDNSKERLTVTDADIKGFSSEKPVEEQTITVEINKLTATFIVKILPVKIVEGVLTFVEPDVTSLVLPKNVTKISKNLFRSGKITEITLNEGLTDIGEQAFAWSAITKINFPKSLKNIETAAFYGCKNLKELDLRKTSMTKIIHETFALNANLVSVKLPAFVNEIEYQAFLNATSLKELELPEGLLKIGNEAFRGNGLVNLKLPNSICYMDQRAFYQSGELLTVQTFGNAPAENNGVELCKMESSTFEHCPKLQHFEIPKGVQIIGWNTLTKSPDLLSIVIPATVKEIDFNAFGNASLKTVSVEGTTPALAKTISGAWQAFPYSIESIKVPAGTVDTYKAAEGWKSYANKIIE